MTPARQHATIAHWGFTLVELMVVLVIVAILSGLSLAGLAVARNRSKADASRFIVRKLSDAILENYETYEDLALSGKGLLDIRKRMREELPDSWAEVLPSAATPTTAAGRAYQRYKFAASPSVSYQSSECLYMIVTVSGLFPELIASIRPENVGDVDNDGAREFWDGWKRPIAFFRWAPGFSSDPPAVVAGRRDYSPLQIADSVNYHDPVDGAYLPGPPPTGGDLSAFALYPLIFSAGPDEAQNDPLSSSASGYGLLDSQNGWNDDDIKSLCVFNPENKGLVGAPDPTNASAYRDNITNHGLVGE